MIEQEYIMLIMNCTKYAKKATFQKMTWLPRIPATIQYYHVIGNEHMADDYTFDHEQHLLWVKTKDDYNSLPAKVISAYHAVMHTFQFTYVFKTDDDQILTNPKFFEVLQGLIRRTPRIHYGGYVVNVKDNYLSQYHKIHPELPTYLPILKTQYCSGRFYFLSQQAVAHLLSKRTLIEKEYLEDYAIGFHMDPYFKQNILHLATNNFFTDIELSDFPALLKAGKI